MLQIHLLSVVVHLAHEDISIANSVLLGEIEAAEILPFSLTQQQTSKVVSEYSGRIVGTCQQQSVQSILKRQQVVYFEEYFGALDGLIFKLCQHVELVDDDVVILDDFVGSIEGHELGETGHVMLLFVFVALDNLFVDRVI